MMITTFLDNVEAHYKDPENSCICNCALGVATQVAAELGLTPEKAEEKGLPIWGVHGMPCHEWGIAFLMACNEELNEDEAKAWAIQIVARNDVKVESRDIRGGKNRGYISRQPREAFRALGKALRAGGNETGVLGSGRFELLTELPAGFKLPKTWKVLVSTSA